MRTTTRVTAPEATAGVSPSRAKLTGRAAVLLLVLAVLAVSYASSMRAWLKQRSDINQLNADIVRKSADVATLRQAKQRLHDPAYIREQAHQRFGWIMPGETSYRVIGADGDVLVDGTSSLSDPSEVFSTQEPEWWQQVYGTVVAAGRPETDADATTSAPQTQRRTPAKSNGHTPRDGRPTDR